MYEYGPLGIARQGHPLLVGANVYNRQQFGLTKAVW